MIEIKPVTIISDNPEKESIMFGFDAYAKTITGLIANKENKTPLVIGIYGSWGSGKTTLMELVRKQLKDQDFSKDERFRKAKTVWFQAWKYSNQDEILAALIEEIFKTMEQDGFLEAWKAMIEKLAKRYQPSKVMSKLVGFTGIDISEWFADLEYKEKLGFYNTFQDFFDRLIWDYLNWRPKKTEAEETDDQSGVLVVFIDDLDRCQNDKIVKVLETIKLFMDKKGCVFVVGAAKEIIEKALAEQYGQEDAGKFMDKIVQVTFNLPQIGDHEFETYVQTKSPHISDEIFDHLPLIMPAMGHNPRQLKRFLNNLCLQESIIGNKEDVDIDFNALLYWGIIEYAYPSFWHVVKNNAQVLSLLKNHISILESRLGDRMIQEITDEELKEVPHSLWEYIRSWDLVEIVKNCNLSENDIKMLISFSSIAESIEDKKLKKSASSITTLDDMVKAPAGRFLSARLGSAHPQPVGRPLR